MLLVIVVVCTVIWLDPSALFSRSDPDLPWNEEFRLRKPGDEAPPAPSPEQPNIEKTIIFEAKVQQEREKRGRIEVVVRPDGTIEGGWSAEYDPDPNTNYLVAGASFTGNSVLRLGGHSIRAENDI